MGDLVGGSHVSLIRIINKIRDEHKYIRCIMVEVKNSEAGPKSK